MFTSPETAREFLFAGNATLTALSKKTGRHFTYKIRRADDGRVFFVSWLHGPENESDYAYMGVISQGDESTLRLTHKSRATEQAECVKAFRYVLNAIHAPALPEQLELRHEGHCGRCGRTLTVPESIDRGIGPECAKHMGVEA